MGKLDYESLVSICQSNINISQMDSFKHLISVDIRTIHVLN